MSTRKIQLKLLGPLRVTAGSEDLTAALSQPKRLALVTWLLLTRPPGLHRRDTLCALLWPESSDEKARATLRWLLSTLRRELGDQTFLTEGDLVGINHAIVSSDAGALLEALEAGQDADAVDLYAGELLPGLHLAEGEAFERWFEERRGELRRGVTRATWRLVERAEADGNVAEAQRWAERAIGIDPEDEAGLRRLMTLHARSGDRAAALRTYETFARRLKEDWATDPEPATLELVERIRAGAFDGTDNGSGQPAGVPRQLARALSGRYRLEQELGAGGMATVYRARDLKHDRDVALKVLRPELTAALGPGRFLQEVRISARLDHPHILTLIDSGETAGFVWYALPYVRGESLRQRLNREKQVSVEETVRIVTQVASAVDYAHRQRVIHRDIKPENILLHEGEAMVTDFGIALAVQEAGGPRLTESGISVGTPQYMSPEQASASGQVDARSDVYSLGAVAYELLVGEPPFTGPTAQAIVAQHCAAPFPEARHSRPDLPAAIDQVLHKATARAPADRYPTAERFAYALRGAVGDVPSVKRSGTRRRWLGPVIGGIAVAVALVGYRLARIDTSLIGKRVLVVPFANHTGNPNLDAMGMVAADWVIQGLQRSGIAEVVDPATAFLTTRDLPNRAPQSMSALRELAAATHAGLLIVGAVTVVGDSAEFTARLVDVRNARVLRVVDPIRARVTDPSVALNELRSRLAGSVVTETDAQLIPLSRSERAPTLEAYQEFVAGIDEFVAVVDGPRQGIKGRSHFQQAIARDSSFTLAMMWLYYTFLNEGMDDSSLVTVKRIANGPDRHTPLVKAWVEIDSLERVNAPLDQQLLANRRAARLSPGSHNDLNLASLLLNNNRRPHEAIEILQRFDVSRNWVTRWYVYWQNLIRAKHMIGDYRGELAVARRARRRLGEPYNGEEIAALAALGDVTSLRSVLDSAFGMRVLGAHPDPFIIAHASHELEAHGHLDAAIALLSWAEPLLRERLATDSSIAARVDHAWTQATLANYRGDRQLAGEARQVLERLLPAMPPSKERARAEVAAFLTALCTEGDSAQIARLPYPLQFHFADPIAELAIAVCKGDRDGAASLLTTLGNSTTDSRLTAPTFAHWLPVLRPLRKDPRFQRWLRPQD